MKRAVVVLIVLLMVLHQDFWWWHRTEPLVFGFIPIGLAWHAGISVAAGVVAALAVRFCWPADVGEVEAPGDGRPRGSAH